MSQRGKRDIISRYANPDKQDVLCPLPRPGMFRSLHCETLIRVRLRLRLLSPVSFLNPRSSSRYITRIAKKPFLIRSLPSGGRLPLLLMLTMPWWAVLGNPRNISWIQSSFSSQGPVNSVWQQIMTLSMWLLKRLWRSHHTGHTTLILQSNHRRNICL